MLPLFQFVNMHPIIPSVAKNCFTGWNCGYGVLEGSVGRHLEGGGMKNLSWATENFEAEIEV